MASTDDERDGFEEEERDVLPDLYDNSDAGDTMSTSECRSVTSDERSLTPDPDELEDVSRDLAKPKVIVFDLDYTLWPFWIDKGINIALPFKQVVSMISLFEEFFDKLECSLNECLNGGVVFTLPTNGNTFGLHKVFDANGREVKSFPDITPLLQRLHNEGYKLGIASEAFYKEECTKLVKLFGWDDYVDYQEIYPGSKIFHFVKIKKASGVEFCDMLYFDDEKEHLAEVAGTCTGITTCWADRGVSEELVEEAFLTFAKNRESSTYFRSKPVTISRRNSTEPFVSLRPLINLRRRNSIENDMITPPPNSVLGGASLATLTNDISALSCRDKSLTHQFNPNLPGLNGSRQSRSITHQFNPNLPGLNGPIGGPPRSKTRRRYSIM